MVARGVDETMNVTMRTLHLRDGLFKEIEWSKDVGKLGDFHHVSSDKAKVSLMSDRSLSQAPTQLCTRCSETAFASLA